MWRLRSRVVQRRMAHVFAGVTPAGGASPAPTAERFNRRGGSQQSHLKFQIRAKREKFARVHLWLVEGCCLRRLPWCGGGVGLRGLRLRQPRPRSLRKSRGRRRRNRRRASGRCCRAWRHRWLPRRLLLRRRLRRRWPASAPGWAGLRSGGSERCGGFDFDRGRAASWFARTCHRRRRCAGRSRLLDLARHRADLRS